MQNYQPEFILSELEYRIRSNPAPDIKPMPGDRWLLSSALQKGIRRGEEERALSAASALWYLDKDRFWRRLHIIALEDVGVSARQEIIEVMIAVSNSRWSRRVGDLNVGLALVSSLCRAVKTRLGDELFTQVEHTPVLQPLRQRLSGMNDDALCDFVFEDQGLVEKAIALRYLAGTKKYPSDVIPPRHGSPELATEVLRELDAPSDLTEACIAALGRSPWPLALFTPLIWLESQKRIQRPIIQQNDLAEVGDVQGVPLYAADTFTRSGQSAFRDLKKAIPELRYFTVKQIGLAVFYMEGCQIGRTWQSDWADEFKQAGEVADIEGAGLALPEYMALRDCLSQNWDKLNQIRHDQINRLLQGDGL